MGCPILVVTGLVFGGGSATGRVVGFCKPVAAAVNVPERHSTSDPTGN
jgi:hypothetical protein